MRSLPTTSKKRWFHKRKQLAFSTTVEDWYHQTIKDAEFYEKHASLVDGKSSRCYFYTIDLQGRLFLEETLPKNVATSIKDVKFLDFFWKRLRPLDERMQEFMELQDIPTLDYPFVSLCGQERNFIRPVATPLVFHTLYSSRHENLPDTLVYAGSLEVPL